MDENELTKMGMEIMLRPVTEIAENTIGLLGGDWLSDRRARNRERLRKKTEELLKSANAKLDTDPSPSIVIPLLSAAQDEGREELLDIWARLLASASDPRTRSSYRRDYVAIVKELEPVDTVLLLQLATVGSVFSNKQLLVFAIERSIRSTEIEVSLQKFASLGLIHAAPWQSSREAQPTALLKELSRALGATEVG